jgi:hypothetical protein
MTDNDALKQLQDIADAAFVAAQTAGTGVRNAVMIVSWNENGYYKIVRSNMGNDELADAASDIRDEAAERYMDAFPDTKWTSY